MLATMYMAKATAKAGTRGWVSGGNGKIMMSGLFGNPQTLSIFEGSSLVLEIAIVKMSS